MEFLDMLRCISSHHRSFSSTCVFASMVLGLVSVYTPTGFAETPAILVPAGFSVEHYADDDLAHDIHCMTIDAKGRVVVSGPGYIRILLDTDDDGKADDYIPFANAPKTGAQGMYFMGPHLLCSGDEGLQIFRDDDHDDKADGPPTTFLKMKAGGEHHVHSIQQGPDGWWYIIAGNLAEVTSSYATLPTSPLKKPEAGVLMRLKPDLSGGEILSDGLRNAYDFAFNVSGDIFTFDSDGERDVSLPWYLPCRVFHLTPQSHAGWTSRSWKRPDDFPDMPPVIASFDRGSPTGVICYRHSNFPSRYDGALFVLDWTFGRIMALSMQEDRGLWKASSAIFAKGSGKFGFAPTDIEVAPDGNLFVSVGGRGTRGSVYRIVNENGSEAVKVPGDSDGEKLEYVLDAPQPLSSWSRATWQPIAKRLGKNAFVNAATDEGRRPIQRMRAIEILTDTFGGLDPATTRLLTTARSVPVRARAAWAVGRTSPDSPNTSAIFSLLNDQEPMVVRFALEALACTRDARLLDKCLPRLAVTLGSKDASVRAATSKLIPVLSDVQQQTLTSLITPSLRSQVWMALGKAQRSDKLNLGTAKVAMLMIRDKSAGIEKKFEALRLLQLSLGDVGPQKDLPGMFESYHARADLEPYEITLNPLRTILAEELPSGTAKYDRELVRTIAMLGSLNRRMIAAMLEGITDESTPSDDIHRLAALTRVQAPRTNDQTQATAKALVNLEHKVRRMKLKQDSNWEDRISELYAELSKVDAGVPVAIAKNKDLGLPGHVLLLKHIPPEFLPGAIASFARQAEMDADYTWTNDVIFALGRSKAEKHQQLIREQFDNLAVQDAVLIVIARAPRAGDRRMFLEGLNSPQISAVDACVKALAKLPKQNTPDEQYLLLATAQRLGKDQREYKIRENIMRLLQNNMLQSFGFVYGTSGYRPQPKSIQRWTAYLEKRFPEYEAPVAGGKAAKQVLSVLDEVSWHSGDADRGEALFTKLSCTRCHGGRKALGPDLDGVAKRFSRSDLFAAIVDPNRDVSDRYQLTTVQTTDGKAYSGLIVYESVDGLILRDSEQKTYRIESEEIESKARRRVSLMPAGLLRNVVDQDLADLDAYLRRL